MTIINTKGRFAYAAVINSEAAGQDDQFMLGLAEENQPGYWPTPEPHGVFMTYEAAALRAEELNAEEFHLTRDEAARIVASSMRKSTRTRRRNA